MKTVEQVRALLSGRLPNNALNPEHATRIARSRRHEGAAADIEHALPRPTGSLGL